MISFQRNGGASAPVDEHARPTPSYEGIPLEQVFALLASRPSGLTSAGAEERLRVSGPNEIPEKKKNPVTEFILRYWGPMPWLLELAMVLSLLLGHYLEMLTIFSLLTINAVIGYLHALNSDRAIDLLKKRLAIRARVLRDEEWFTEDAALLVPGDVIEIGLGGIVPADAKLIEGDLSVDDSALTGESLPVHKTRGDVVYSGAMVRRGRARCLVVNTGPKTHFGKTAELVRTAKPKSHQAEIMLSITRYMMFIGLAALFAVLARGVIAHGPQHLETVLNLAVIFLMGSVPVALPAVLTIVQTVGARELVKKKALVTRLDSIEDAASVDILCLDKTGTITQNRLSVAEVVPFSGHDAADVVRTAALASREESSDLIDQAVLSYAQTTGANVSQFTVLSFTPFDPALKRTEAIVEKNGLKIRAVKGAVTVVLSLVGGSKKAIEGNVEETVHSISRKGFRTLAVARSREGMPEELDLIGLLALADPVRPDSKTMIKAVTKLGIKPKMLTGDHIAIAREVAGQVGLGQNIIRPSDVKSLSGLAQVRAVEEADGFAEIYPEDKHYIVKLLQSNGHSVGMTGDGVNDAAALKQAEMGIAVRDATDVAKASASIILTESGMGVVVDAVIASRRVYQRMLSWVINKVCKVIQFIGILTIGVFIFDRLVLSLLGMTFLVFANDFVTMSLATDNVRTTPNPNKWNVRNITIASALIGALLVLSGTAAMLVGVRYLHLDAGAMQTFVMLLLVFMSQFRVLIVRERRFFWSSRPGNALILSTIGTLVGFALLGRWGVFVAPLTSAQVALVLGFSLAATLIIDVPKYLIFKKILE